ncbi:GTPase [Burkholderia gladioli]|uniref:GTPase n=1 Tax=Burkholderia gladioli TaxID=28095 RepID=UPI00163E59DF|nr:GTPase [Burkholderia gladioli]
MNRSSIRAQMPALVAGHVPRNIRKFKFSCFDDQPTISSLGLQIDPKPFVGKVVATTTEAIVVKTGRAEFAVLDRQLATQVPAEGTKVMVQPYARRRFDGKRADNLEETTHFTADGQPYTVQSITLGTAAAKLPIATPQCPELQDLVQQLEQLPAPDRHRCITHMLVDANARDFEVVDPAPKDIIRTPPAIRFTVSSEKFTGRVAVIYDRGMDAYIIESQRDGESVDRIETIYFDDLGHALEQLIDDGQWRRIRVDVIAPTARRAARH